MSAEGTKFCAEELSAMWHGWATLLLSFQAAVICFTYFVTPRRVSVMRSLQRGRRNFHDEQVEEVEIDQLRQSQ